LHISGTKPFRHRGNDALKVDESPTQIEEHKRLRTHRIDLGFHPLLA
jgi:hypothetical protein